MFLIILCVVEVILEVSTKRDTEETVLEILRSHVVEKNVVWGSESNGGKPNFSFSFNISWEMFS